MVLCGHSQLAILTVQWDTPPGAAIGTAWTLTTGNTCCSLGYTPMGYRMNCVDTFTRQYLLFSTIHPQGGIVGTVWTLTPGNTYCSVGYIPIGFVGTVWTLTTPCNTYCSLGYTSGAIVGTVWTLTTGNTYCSVGYTPMGYRRNCVDTHSWQYLLFC